MALAPKKTYSRRGNELFDHSESEKENVDPFDVLMASPLKQDVQFQPLGFWGKKVKDLDSKKKKEVKFGLYEANDSGHNSSWKKSKSRTLQPKSKHSNLGDTKKNRSTAFSFLKKGEQEVLPNESLTLKSAKEIIKHKGHPPKTKSKMLNLSCKTCCIFKPLNRQSSCANCTRSSGIFNKTFNSVKFKCDDEKIVNNLEICRDSSSVEQLEDVNESLINKSNEGVINETVHCNESMDETLVLLPEDYDRHKFVTIRRHFNFPGYLSYTGSFNCPAVSDYFRISSVSPINTRNEQNETTSPMSEDYTIQAEFSGNISDTVFDSLYSNESNNETFSPEDFISQMGSDESATLLESHGVRFSNDSDFIYFGNSELEDTIEELQEEESGKLDVTADTSLTSSDTFSEQDTVIQFSQAPQEKNASVAGAQAEENDVCHYGSSPDQVSLLTTGVSDLSISNVDNDDEDKENRSLSVELRNITKKRGGFLEEDKNDKSSSRVIDGRCRDNTKKSLNDSELDESFEPPLVTDRMSLDWNRTVCLGNPMFESTRVLDMGPVDGEITQRQSNGLEKMDFIFEETQSFSDCSYALKPGKQWFRSMSVLKQIQSGHLRGGALESTRITGRKFESFVQDLIKMQNEQSNIFATVADNTVQNKSSANVTAESGLFNRLSSDKTVLEGRRGDESELDVLSKSASHKRVLGKSLLRRTVKLVNHNESSSAFRSTLGLDGSRSLIHEGTANRDSIPQESVEISPREFILNQCGQEDVLPFEDYFNEKTLPDCKKIGEGVYGEVFMCSDTVIKIIPIEGRQQINGAPQKSFEEIISEVVIASKLSNLREGDQNRTDGFSEMKRCWCVKGKYPEYLLKLWNAYENDRGSENDSPVIFRDDQLYIILELANGGKDLESFVFSSSLQALSVFIQVAFSLAAAEKAFEFEHRDLHWGNVLISKTNDKFASVVLDEIEYKIPTKGVRVCIIDFTLSRINHEGCCIFNDLATDPELFTAHGDYQFEIYRMMRGEVKNDWSMFSPKTNLFWLHYTVDKMMKMVRYKIRNSKVHAKHMKDLKTLESVVLDHNSSTSFVLSKRLNDILIKL